jgi:hypothetical protein
MAETDAESGGEEHLPVERTMKRYARHGVTLLELAAVVQDTFRVHRTIQNVEFVSQFQIPNS